MTLGFEVVNIAQTRWIETGRVVVPEEILTADLESPQRG